MTRAYIFFCLVFVTLASTEAQAGDPLFPNSIVSNDIDFILDTDPDAFTSLTFIGRQDKEMPGNGGNLFDEDTFVFEATFSNGKIVGIWCHSSFITQEAAQEYADKLCPRLGKLPFVQRDMLDHVCINVGNHTAFAETQGHFFVLYSQNMDARISTHDLEETVFHESVHASIQDIYEDDTAWTNAQAADPSFVTEYAQSLPHLEDMPESALFAYTFISYPGRLDADIEAWLIENIPNRIQFFESIYPPPFVGVRNNALSLTRYVYPNPAKEMVHINTSADVEKIQLISISGQIILEQNTFGNQTNLNVSELETGIYFIKIFSNNNVITRKLVIE